MEKEHIPKKMSWIESNHKGYNPEIVFVSHYNRIENNLYERMNVPKVMKYDCENP